MNGFVRSASWLAFFGIILVSWVWMYMMSTGMGLDLLGRPSMSMGGEMTMSSGAMETESAGSMQQDMKGDETMSQGMAMESGAKMDGMDMGGMDMGGMDMSMMTRFTPLFFMWAGMMAAMMLPTLVPTLRSYEDLMVSADGTRAGWIGVLLGYFVVWVAFAAAIAGAQLLLLRSGLIDMMGIPFSRYFAAFLLIAVGLFQFTRAKEICHGVCHSPMTYFLGHWRTGFAGGARMGLGLGAFCVGCCWGFMVLGFAGGVMNLAWMGLATLFMIIEKLPQIGHYVTKPMGVILIVAGVAIAGWPLFAGG